MTSSPRHLLDETAEMRAVQVAPKHSAPTVEMPAVRPTTSKDRATRDRRRSSAR